MSSPTWELPRSIASAALMVDLGLEHGAALSALLDGTGITEELLRDPTGEIRGTQELRLVRNLIAALPDVPGLGLQAGLRYRITTHGIWGFAVMSSPTVASALQVFVKYFDLSFSFNEVSLEDHGDRSVLVFDNRSLPSDVRLFMLERDWSALLATAQLLVPGGIEVERVAVMDSDPGYADLYRALGAQPEFDQPRNEIALGSALLLRPMIQADAHTAAVFEQQCAELLNRRRERLGTACAVRDLLLRTRRFTTEQEEIASGLSMSVRTLRRRLADEGTSYRDIVAETAGLLAEELLGAGLTVEDVAHRLGYGGAPAFTIAFKKWKGVTPGVFARSARGLARTSIK